jgi:hypothetical protein
MPQICTDIARLLRDPEGTEIMNEFFGKIDISAIRYELGLPNEKEPGTRMLEVDDLLLSLISRFPDQIPYAEVTWARGATFITPAGVEWFDRSSLLEPRREEYLASLGAPTPAV